MSEQKEKVKSGKNIELDTVTVINEGVSLSEKKAEEPKQEEVKETKTEAAPVEEKSAADMFKPDTVITPDVSVTPASEPVVPSEKKEEAKESEITHEEKTPDIPSIPIDLDKLSSAVTPEVSTPDVKLPTGFDIPSVAKEDAPHVSETTSLNQQSTPYNTFNASTYSNPYYTANEKPVAMNPNAIVYRNESDVERLIDEAMKEAREVIDKKVTNPSKTVIKLLNEYRQWGRDVTTNGLNRKSFEKYDELEDMCNGIKSVFDDEPKSFDSENTAQPYNPFDQNISNNFGRFGDDDVNNKGNMGFAA